MQAAAPPAVTPTSLGMRLGRHLSWLGRALMLALVVLAWLGVRPGTASDNESDSGAPSATGGGGGGQPAIGGDGELVGVGTRVQTQELVSEGGSGEWFAGTVLALHSSGHATVVYDDGEEWTGALSRIYLLQVYAW